MQDDMFKLCRFLIGGKLQKSGRGHPLCNADMLWIAVDIYVYGFFKQWMRG